MLFSTFTKKGEIVPPPALSTPPSSSTSPSSSPYSDGVRVETHRGQTKYTEIFAQTLSGKSYTPISPVKSVVIDEPNMTLSLGGTLAKIIVTYTDYTTHPSFLPAVQKFFELCERRRRGDLSVSDAELVEASKYSSLPGYSDLPVVVIFPSMSHSVNIATLPLSPSSIDSTTASAKSIPSASKHAKAQGWWEEFVGPGESFAIDTNHFRVVVGDNLGGPFGTTGPLSHVNPVQTELSPDGKPRTSSRLYLADFPIITPIDQAVTHTRLLEFLGIVTRIDAASVDLSVETVRPRPLCADEKPFTLVDYVRRNLPSDTTVKTLMNCQSETSQFQIPIPEINVGDPAHAFKAPGLHSAAKHSASTHPPLPVIMPRVSFRANPQLHCAIGSSMGGMQALTLASLFPGLVPRVAAMCCTTRASPSTVALRSIQRTAVFTDPAWEQGQYPLIPGSHGPVSGMETARMVGTFSYRSRAELDLRFRWEHFLGAQTEVESYLRHQASKFPVFYDANSYLVLSKCMDLTGISPSRQHYTDFVRRMGGTAANPTELFLLGVHEDTLTPADELRDTAAILGAAGKHVEFEVLSSLQGHDAFLTEKHAFAPRLRAFVNAPRGEAIETLRSFTKSIHE